MSSLPEITVPVHIHVGSGACRHLGDLTPVDGEDLSAALVSMLRSAADRMERAAAVLADAEQVLQAVAD